MAIGLYAEAAATFIGEDAIRIVGAGSFHTVAVAMVVIDAIPEFTAVARWTLARRDG